MNTDDLIRLADRAEDVSGRQAERLAEVRARIRVARRRRAAGGLTASVAVAIAVVASAGALRDPPIRTEEPIDRPSRGPTETKSPQDQVKVADGQTTVTADVGPGDIRGWVLRGSRTNDAAGADGEADLSLTVTTGGLGSSQSYVAPFCRGDANTWWVVRVDLGGVDGVPNADGSLGNGTRALVGRCSTDVPAELPPPRGDYGPQRDEPAEKFPVRMFLTASLSAGAQRCLEATLDVDACLVTHGVEPVGTTEATFGFGVYEHRSGPTVLSILGGTTYDAMVEADGVEYLLDRAVVASTGAKRLVANLPASDHRRIVAVVVRETDAMQECDGRLGFEPPKNAAEERFQLEEVERRCINELELRIGDGPPTGREPASGTEILKTTVAAGEAQDITVEVVRNDPRNVHYAVVIWEERS